MLCNNACSTCTCTCRLKFVTAMMNCNVHVVEQNTEFHLHSIAPLYLTVTTFMDTCTWHCVVVWTCNSQGILWVPPHGENHWDSWERLTFCPEHAGGQSVPSWHSQSASSCPAGTFTDTYVHVHLSNTHAPYVSLIVSIIIVSSFLTPKFLQSSCIFLLMYTCTPQEWINRRVRNMKIRSPNFGQLTLSAWRAHCSLNNRTTKPQI